MAYAPEEAAEVVIVVGQGIPVYLAREPGVPRAGLAQRLQDTQQNKKAGAGTCIRKLLPGTT